MSEIVQRIGRVKQSSWQSSLSEVITSPEQLFDFLNLDKSLLPAAKAACELFPLKVSQHYLSQIEKSNFEDPLLKQILPLGLELQNVAGYSNDPLQEKQFNPLPGLLHKYASRVLITVSQACAIHCRYCFRREFDYQANNPGRKVWKDYAQYIMQHPEINEVIYSGGDPLTASDAYLADLTAHFTSLTQIKRLRIHTRLPILIPERITESLLQWMQDSKPLQMIVVLHCNHRNELSDLVIQNIQKLKSIGVTLLNQSVLLKGVNDTANDLIDLSEALFAIGVLPYYIHLLDKVSGTAHFDVPLQKAKEILAEMQGRLPGYLLPKLVREEPGKVSKTLMHNTI